MSSSGISSATPDDGNQLKRVCMKTASDCSMPMAKPPMIAGTNAKNRPSTAAASAGTMKSV